MAANSTVSISGVVFRRRGEDRYSVPGAMVRATNGESRASVEAETDERGYYALGPVDAGQWELSVEKAGLLASPVVADLRADTDSMNLEMSRGLKVQGSVYRDRSNESIDQALVKAVSGEQLLYQTTDDNGAFTFENLKAGQWSFTAMHEECLASEAQELTLDADELDLRFDLARSMSTADASTGRKFFSGLLGGFCILISLYIFLHAMFPQAPDPASVTLEPLVAQAQSQLEKWDDISVNLELEATVRDIRTLVNNVVTDNGNLSPADKRSIDAILGSLDEARRGNQKDAAFVRLANLREMIGGLSARGFAFWGDEPWRLLEVLFWALAGVLVNRIIVNSSHLRWKKFFRESIIIQLSHIVTIPVVVMVGALLVSLVTLRVTLPGGNGVELDLSDPSILVAFSFILGCRPWSIWHYIRTPAEK